MLLQLCRRIYMMKLCLYVCLQVEKEEIESLIPKGVSELTKQQIRYLLQVSSHYEHLPCPLPLSPTYLSVHPTLRHLS